MELKEPFDIIINSPGLDAGIVKMALAINDVSVYNTLAYTFFRKAILGETREEYLATHSDLDRYVEGGYVERKSHTYEGPRDFTPETKEMNQEQKASFEQCIAYLEQKGVKTVLVQTPILYDYYSSIVNIAEYDQYFRTVVKPEYYFNFSDSVYRETKYFYDHHHLNKKGVDRFNDELLSAMKSHFEGLRQR